MTPLVYGKAKAALIHLGVSLGLSLIIAGLVFLLWYPAPYSSMSGGKHLFVLVVAVDVMIGPTLTLVAFNPNKTRAHLARDLGTIALLQMGAMAYGVHTAYSARPVALVFEVDRFRVIPANEVLAKELSTASSDLRHLSISGPKLIGTRTPRSGAETLSSIDMALHGYDIGQRPSFWVPYRQSRSSVLARSRPVIALIQHAPAAANSIKADLRKLNLSLATTRFLPLQTKQGNWVVFINDDGDPAGFSAQNGFF